MDKCKYLEIINSIFFKNYNFKDKKTNSLILSISYSFNLISKENYNIWNICYLILKKNKVSDKTYHKFFYLITVFYCFFASYQNIYALPCLLDTKLLNSQMTLHLVFGEHLTQLTNFILISEAINIIHNNLESDEETLDFINFCHSELDWLNTNNILIKNFNNFDKNDIKNESLNMHYKLFRFAIYMTYKLLGKKRDKELDISIKKLYKISFPEYKVNNAT